MTDAAVEPPAGVGALGVFAPGILEGTVAVVTGGGRGIGRAIAVALAACGADVVVAARDEDAMATTVTEVEKAGRRCLAVRTNIREPTEVDHLREAVLSTFGSVHHIINNAGGQYPAKPSAINDRGWRSVVDLNLNGTWNVISRFMGDLAEQRDGSIVNIVHSFVFDRGAPLFAHSGAARAGVVNLTRSLAPYLARQSVTINALAPGIVDTSAFRDDEMGPYGLDAAQLDQLVTQMGVVRMGTPEEVAAFVVFLCSAAGRYINGTVLVQDNAATQNNWPLLDLLDLDQL